MIASVRKPSAQLKNKAAELVDATLRRATAGGHAMGGTLKTGAVALALSSLVGNAWAENVCARAQDLTALQVAAVQQELMVAALSCDEDVPLYNSFVATYQRELRTSDAALQAYFLRRDARTGTSDYHAFKTKLANNFSVRSGANKKAYCRNAQAIFHQALEEKKSLAGFVLAQPMSVDASYSACGESVPGGAMVARAPVIESAPPQKSAAATPSGRGSFLALDKTPPPPIAAAPAIAAPAERFQPDNYPSGPNSTYQDAPVRSSARDNRAEANAADRNATGPSGQNDYASAGNYDEAQARDPQRADAQRFYQNPSFQPPARSYRYDTRDAYANARVPYGRTGDPYYDWYYGGYPYYRNPYWYAPPRQLYLRRR
jgi:hypothetical protein